jgi:hypothetical protein
MRTRPPKPVCWPLQCWSIKSFFNARRPKTWRKHASHIRTFFRQAIIVCLAVMIASRDQSGWCMFFLSIFVSPHPHTKSRECFVLSSLPIHRSMLISLLGLSTSFTCISSLSCAAVLALNVHAYMRFLSNLNSRIGSPGRGYRSLSMMFDFRSFRMQHIAITST